MNTNTSDYDQDPPADGQGGVSKDDSAKGDVSTKATDTKDVNSSAEESERLFEAEEESQLPLACDTPSPGIGADSGNKDTLRVDKISPRKRPSPASTQRSDSTPTGPMSCPDVEEETHDGPRKSVADSTGDEVTPSAEGNKTLGPPPAKHFKPSTNNWPRTHKCH